MTWGFRCPNWKLVIEEHVNKARLSFMNRNINSKNIQKKRKEQPTNLELLMPVTFIWNQMPHS